MNGHFAWSVRRELWESRAIWIAPLVTAGFVLLAFFFGLHSHKEKLEIFGTLNSVQQTNIVVMPYSMAASVILLTSFIVALFYSLDALNAERKDRSILFWKSMPVSDATTVLSKLAIPMLVLPATAWVVAFATQLVLLAVSFVYMGASGIDVRPILGKLPLIQMSLVMAYGLVVHALWFAPIYALFLLISVWTKRAPFLWATAPIAVAILLEKIAFGTSALFQFLRYRLVGAMGEAFVPGADRGPITALSQIDPGRFVTSLGLWSGLIFAAICIALAIQIRRSREPL